MSGGHFDYQEYHIREIAESVKEIIERNNKPRAYDTLDYVDKKWWSSDHDDKACTEENYYKEPYLMYEYNDEVIKRFKAAHVVLQLAAILAERVDYLVCDDDGEDSFKNRIIEDLHEAVSYTNLNMVFDDIMSVV